MRLKDPGEKKKKEGIVETDSSEDEILSSSDEDMVRVPKSNRARVGA